MILVISPIQKILSIPSPVICNCCWISSFVTSFVSAAIQEVFIGIFTTKIPANTLLYRFSDDILFSDFSFFRVDEMLYVFSEQHQINNNWALS